jgi:V/A-type H+-transporting ATPase subunit A
MEVRNKIARSKYISEEELAKIDTVQNELVEAVDKLIEEGGLKRA